MDPFWSIQFSGFEYIHRDVITSPLSNYRPLSPPRKQAPYPPAVTFHSHLSPTPGGILSVSVDWPLMDISYMKPDLFCIFTFLSLWLPANSGSWIAMMVSRAGLNLSETGLLFLFSLPFLILSSLHLNLLYFLFFWPTAYRILVPQRRDWMWDLTTESVDS